MKQLEDTSRKSKVKVKKGNKEHTRDKRHKNNNKNKKKSNRTKKNKWDKRVGRNVNSREGNELQGGCVLIIINKRTWSK